ncbi:MAG: class II fructose-bisphosphate aldolase [Spirochaetaceae bacterium]|nr:class II fructose-bisphosphate aldolase [Spirochaetaceae bacterium]
MTMTEIIDYSRRHTVGVGMFNIVNMEFARAIFDASQETGLPVMFGIPERFMRNFYSPDCMALICREMIKQAKAPMAIHLDHGKTFDGVMIALRAGFSSVMFDGSSLDYEENVKQTAEIVKIAHSFGVTVEGELGYVGRAGTDELTPDSFTRPDQAEDFVRRTGIDALAVAIGNQHGRYQGIPKLDFERLRAIRERIACGLVLHGGSGIGNEDFKEAIRYGINKINIYTAMDTAAKDFTRNSFGNYASYLDYTKDLTTVVRDVVLEHIKLFASAKTM